MPNYTKNAAANLPTATASNYPNNDTPAPYLFRGQEVRAILDDDGTALFVAADVARALQYANAKDMARMVRSHHKGLRRVSTPGGPQTMTVLTEPGLFAAIMKSRASLAEQFQDWVTDEVLPSLRKTGTYSAQPAASEDQVIAQALHILDARLKERDAEVAALAPKADAYDQFIDCEGTFSVGTVAKMLGIGPNRLFQMLRDKGIFLEHGPRRNTPRQTYARHFSVKAAIYSRTSGIDGVSYTTHVLPSGVDLIRRLLADDLPGALADQARPTLQPH